MWSEAGIHARGLLGAGGPRVCAEARAEVEDVDESFMRRIGVVEVAK